MLKFRHATLIKITGYLWLILGVYLFHFGATLLIEAMPLPSPYKMWTHPLLETLSPFTGGREYAALIIMSGCLCTGMLKARFVFSRSINKIIKRIRLLPEPSPLFKIYSLPYYLLIATMICMGIILRRSHLPLDLRAACYLSIGAAMMIGSSVYFKPECPPIKYSDKI